MMRHGRTFSGLLAVIVLLWTGTAGAFQPFFDDDPKTRWAPPDPELTDLDLDVLMLCGRWGGRVEAVDFEQMMLKPEHRETLERIHAALGGRIFSKAVDMQDFVHQLRRVWFEQKGFKHVFCGEPGDGGLGGLHYAPRYWQAQDEGWAGYRRLKADHRKRSEEKCRRFYIKEKIRPPIFTTSIEFINPESPRDKVKCMGGYHRDLNAERLLIAGTQGFKQANKRVGRNSKEACLVETRLPGVAPFYSTLVIKSRALRTFYPVADKRPYCPKNKRDFRACLCSRL